MAYIAIWLKGRQIVAEEEFEDLLTAQASILEHMAGYQEALGANSVKVWDGSAIYFQVDKRGAPL